jgi:hypothetical protein
MRGSQSATVKTTKAGPMETTTTKTTAVETTTTAETTTAMEASSTTAAAVPGCPCCGTERHEGDAS